MSGLLSALAVPRYGRRAAPFGAASYSIASLTGAAEIGAIAHEWAALERRSAAVSFFQSAAWSQLACTALRQAQDDQLEPLVLTVRRGRELVAIAPLRIVERGPIRLAVDLTDPFGQYGGILVADDVNAATIVADIVAALTAAKIADGLYLRRVRSDSAVCEALLDHGFTATTAEAAPFVDLRPYPSFDAYLKTVNAKSRKNLRNLRNRLARMGPVSHRIVSGAEVGALIDQSFERRLRWLDDNGVPSMAFAHPAFGALLDGIRELACDGRISMLAMALHCGEVPVSMQWGFVHRGRYYAYIAARNPEYDACSPGRLHLEDVVRTCYEQGIGICDFLVPAVPYKLTWTAQATSVVDIAVPFTVGGQLFLDIWNRRLRPALKRRYGALPVELRRVLRRMAAYSS